MDDMSNLSIHLFGHFSAALDGTPLTGLHTVRLQALLACLLLTPRPISRQQLAYQFWPESSEPQARTNLRNLIHLLRNGLPNADRLIRADAQSLEWLGNAAARLDVHEFEKALAAAPGISPDRAQLERAVTIYQGDLLPDCYDDWIIPERDRLRKAFLSALEALVADRRNRARLPRRARARPPPRTRRPISPGFPTSSSSGCWL